MSLLARINEARKCRVDGCEFDRFPGAEFCGTEGASHLGDFWKGRLSRTATGYTKLPTPRWLGTARDLTDWRAA